VSAIKVIATFVPRGALIKDGKRRTIYRGDDFNEATRARAWMEAWAHASTCGGVVLIDTYRGEGKTHAAAVQCPTRGTKWEPKPRIGEGYPPHGCGGPLVPPDVAGVQASAGALVCVGCHAIVRASAEVQMRAAAAAKHECETAQRGGQ
jgi:hypothetical protein